MRRDRIMNTDGAETDHENDESCITEQTSDDETSESHSNMTDVTQVTQRMKTCTHGEMCDDSATGINDAREDGCGGGGYIQLLSPLCVENAKTDRWRFKGVVEAIRQIVDKCNLERDAVSIHDSAGPLKVVQLKDTLPWVPICNR